MADQWLQATNAGTARGIDNISAAELKQLPFQAVKDLCCVMDSYKEGFPKWFSMAKTYLVPKVDGTPTAADIRPISVLPQLRRLWSKVVCAQIFKHLASQIPKQVTGMLQHRGPMDSAYEWQYWLGLTPITRFLPQDSAWTCSNVLTQLTKREHCAYFVP